MDLYKEYVAIIETDEDPQFAFAERHLRDVDRAVRGIDQGSHMPLREIGQAAGEVVMRRLLPEGTVGQTVDVLFSMIEDKDPNPDGWGSPATHFLNGGVAGALRVAAEHRRANPTT